MRKLKYFSVLVCSLLLSFYVTAQNPGKAKVIRFGLNASPNFGWISPNTDQYASNGSKLGFNYGILGEFSFINNYSIATGFYIKSSGGKLKYPYQISYNNTLTEGKLKREYNLRYVEIPVAIKMNTRPIGYFSYFGIFGLGTAFLMNAKADDEFETNGGLTINKSENNDIQSDVLFIRESLIIGLGTEYSLGGTTSLVFSIIFNNGFTDILSGENNYPEPLKENATSSQLEFNIGVLF